MILRVRNQAAMVVKSFAVKTGSDAGGPKPVSKLALGVLF